MFHQPDRRAVRRPFVRCHQFTGRRRHKEGKGTAQDEKGCRGPTSDTPPPAKHADIRHGRTGSPHALLSRRNGGGVGAGGRTLHRRDGQS